jgi:hypothetical protein
MLRAAPRWITGWRTVARAVMRAAQLVFLLMLVVIPALFARAFSVHRKNEPAQVEKKK